MLTIKPLPLLWGILALIMLLSETQQSLALRAIEPARAGEGQKQPVDLSKAEITLSLTPASCMEHCTIRVSITVRNYEPDRQLCLAFHNDEASPADAPDRRSCWPWGGRRLTDITIRNIPAGSYDVVASLTDAGGRRAVRKLHVGGRYDVTEPSESAPASGNNAILFSEEAQWPE